MIKMQNIFTIEQIRNGKVINQIAIPNAVTDGGKLDTLNTYLGSTVKKAPWSIGLIADAAFTAVAANDSMASHAGWAEFETYDETVRQPWGPATASNAAITGTNPAQFTISAGVEAGTKVRGLFLAESSTKGESVSLLWSTATFASAVDINAADEFKVTYTVRLA